MPGFGSLAQTPDEPYPEEGAGMPETYQSPAGRALANLGIGLAKAIWDIPRKLGQAAEVPAGLRREDVTDIPVRHGITGTNQFGSEPQDELVEGTTGSAINRIGTGLPFAPRGVGAFGGRLNAAVADAPPDYLYHGTGKSNRESILRNGLLRSKSDDGGIYLTSAPQSEIPSNKIDRWKVDVRGLKLEPDMTTEAAPGEKWFVHNEGDIPPSRLSLSGHESPYAGWHEAMEGIKSYHGSPHNYPAERLIQHPSGETEFISGAPDILPDVPVGAQVLKDFPLGRMRSDKIGTGEGAQAYGHGLYAAEHEPVAKGYRDALMPKDNASVLAQRFLDEKPALRPGEAWTAEDQRGLALQKLDSFLEQQRGNPALTTKGGLGDTVAAARKIIESGNSPGHMYELNIKADPEHFLDWDKPLSEQHPKVAQAIRALPHYDDNLGAGRVYESLSRELGSKGGAPYVSQALREAGIPGIKYLDQGSRTPGGLGRQQLENSISVLRDDITRLEQTGGGDLPRLKEKLSSFENALAAMPKATHNYVVFDDKLIDILRKYGWAGLVGSAGLLGGKDASKEM